jgi:hypothetical protein
MTTQQSELFRRADECERRDNVVSDPGKKQIYRRLHDMWIWLACERLRLSSRAAAELAATIVDIQSVLDRGKKRTIHYVTRSQRDDRYCPSQRSE